MQEFLGKYIYIVIKKPDEKPMWHKCAKVISITDTHISLFDTFDNKPYLHKVIHVEDIQLSNKQPGVSE